MYNENVKMNFINSMDKASIKKYTICLFNKMEKIETKNNLDISNMSSKNIIKGLEKSNYLLYSSVRTDISLLRKYFYWYNENIHLINMKDLLSINAKDIDLTISYRNQLVRNEEELFGIISYAPAKEGYLENPVLLLSWVGLTLKEILALKNEDVFMRGNCIFINTQKRIYQISSPGIVERIEDYKLVKKSERNHKYVSIVYPDNLGFFIKNMLTKQSVFIGRPIISGNVRKKIRTYMNLLPDEFKKVTIDNVLFSGRLNRVYEDEIKTGKLSKEKLLNELKTKFYYLNDSLRSYECYKRAFNLKVDNKAE